MKNHFTHGDDIGIAYTFLKEDLFQKACKNNLTKKEGEFFYNALGRDEERFCKLYYYPYIATVIPRNWTYAPFQYWFTQALLKPEKSYSYRDVKWNGRIPSFLFHILGLFLFYWLLKKKIFTHQDESSIPLILTLLAAFSLEQRIMASQMESYAIGLTSNCLALYAILKLQKIGDYSKKQLFGISFALALSIAMQYQALLLVVSGLAATLATNLKISMFKTWLKKFLIFNLFFIVCLGLTLAILFLRHIGGGINWNAGTNSEYIISAKTIGGKFSEFFSLIWDTSGYNFYSILSGIEFNANTYANSLGTLFLLFFALGFIFLFKKSRSNSQNRFLLITFLTYTAIYLALVFFGRLSFSPTRHFLFFLPVILILIGYGVLLIRPIKYSSIYEYGLMTIVIFYATASLKLFATFEEKRVDTTETFNIPKIFFESKADIILVDQFDMEPFFMPELANQQIYRYRPKPLCRDFPPLASLAYPESIKALWYSKRVMLDANGAPTTFAPYEGGAIKHYLLKVLEDCHPNLSITSDNVSVKKLSDVVVHRSDTEIDLSNLTKNGSNELFLQSFELKFNPINKN